MEKKKLVKLLLLGRIHECVYCGHQATEDDSNPVVYESDPYASEIYDDQTPIWECADCRYESAMDI